jgi:putative NIF3 family GTP cyclohydrolase 1 type 2
VGRGRVVVGTVGVAVAAVAAVAVEAEHKNWDGLVTASICYWGYDKTLS